ncbi:unnamed protein product [Lampetra fluviatilis]
MSLVLSVIALSGVVVIIHNYCGPQSQRVTNNEQKKEKEGPPPFLRCVRERPVERASERRCVLHSPAVPCVRSEPYRTFTDRAVWRRSGEY